MSAPRHVVIAGAGIGGLFASLALAATGWRVTLTERESTLGEFGAGLQLSPNATRLLEPFGLIDDLKDRAVSPEALRIRRGNDGSQLHHAKLGKTIEADFGAPFLVAHRADLQAALLARVLKTPGVTLQTGHQLEDIREAAESISARFQTAVGDVSIAADLVIGADGLWSRARQLAGLPSPSRPSGKTAWRALVPRETVPLFARAHETALWLGRDAHLVHYPVQGGAMINIVAIIEDDWREEGWSAPGNPDILAERFSTWHSDARALIASMRAVRRWALIDRAPESRWSRSRMTLLGDAAHPMLPFLAQGASQAIEDAACLSACLNQQPDIAKALKAYDALRIPRTARIQRLARRQAQIYHLTGLPAQLRDLALRMMPGNGIIKRFDWIYSHDAANISAQ